MVEKRGIILFLGISLVLVSTSLIVVENNFLGKFTGWVSASLNLQILLDIQSPDSVNIYLNDSTGEVTLNWSQVVNCQGYKIWYSDNVTEILQINHSNLNYSLDYPANVIVVGNTNTSWIDSNAGSVSQRYYAVAAYMGDLTTTANDKVGKYNLTIYGEDNIKQTLLGAPLEQNISIFDVSAPNDFSWVYTIDHTNNDTWKSSFSLSGSWYGDLSQLDFGYGYLFDYFENKIDITNTGVIPTGNVTQIIYGEDNIKQTLIGWESISTNGSLQELIPSANDFSWVYTIDHTNNDTWKSSFSLSGSWYGDLSQFEAGNGYLFDYFNSELNITYERNPY